MHYFTTSNSKHCFQINQNFYYSIININVHIHIRVVDRESFLTTTLIIAKMISTIITAVSRDESSIVTRILTEIYDYIQLITKIT